MAWKCPECGSLNHDSIIKCVCGYELQPGEEVEHIEEIKITKTSMVICPKCKEENSVDTVKCAKCNRSLLGKLRNPVIMLILCIVTLNIYWGIWLYKIYSEVRLRSTTATKIKPGEAVGCLFIPLYNIYWIFRVLFDFPFAIRCMQLSDPPTGRLLNNGLVTVLMIVSLAFGFFTRVGDSLAENLFTFLFGSIILWLGILISQNSLNNHWKAHISKIDNYRG